MAARAAAAAISAPMIPAAVILVPAVRPAVRPARRRAARSRPAPATATWMTTSRSESRYLASAGAADPRPADARDAPPDKKDGSELNFDTGKIDVNIRHIDRSALASGVSDVACTAVGCRSGNPASCLRGDDRIRAWRGPVRRSEGNVASSHRRLDLGRPDGGSGGQFVLDPSDPAARSVEPDPPAVALYAGGASARCMDGAPSPGRRSSPHHDPDFFRGAGDRRAVYAAAGADHAQRRIWVLTRPLENAVRREAFSFRNRPRRSASSHRFHGSRKGASAAS